MRMPAYPQYLPGWISWQPRMQVGVVCWNGSVGPRRGLDNSPLREEEFQFAFHEQTGEGVSRWAALRGRIQDATRAEMVALLMALTAPGSLHVGQDSDAAVSLLHKIIRAPLDVREKPVWLIPNGDLIGTLREAARRKGMHAQGAPRLKSHTATNAEEPLWNFPERRQHHARARATRVGGDGRHLGV